MTLFFIAAAVLVVLALLILLLPLLRASNHAEADLLATNVSLARERLRTLDAAVKDGAIDADTQSRERERLEVDLAEVLAAEAARPSLHADEGHTPGQRNKALALAVAIGVAMPVAAGALYLRLGNPSAIVADAASTIPGQPSASGQDGTAPTGSAPALGELLPRLEERLAASPDDVDGWRLLGRSYLSINEFAAAANALEKARALEPADADTLAQLAEAQAMSAGGELQGAPTERLQEALTINAQHEPSLWLYAIALQQAGKHAEALDRLAELREIARDNPSAIQAIDELQVQSREALGLADSAPDGTASPDAAADESESENLPRIAVSVTLSPAAAAAVSDDMAVFIFARASEGPPMPLAVSRHTVADLPLNVTLDNSMAMVPDMSLARFTRVDVVARVSINGDPVAASGDWYAEELQVTLNGEASAESTTQVTLTISQQTP